MEAEGPHAVVQRIGDVNDWLQPSACDVEISYRAALSGRDTAALIGTVTG
jgi:hypothetical protein